MLLASDSVLSDSHNVFQSVTFCLKYYRTLSQLMPHMGYYMHNNNYNYALC